ncbi:ATP-binding cassette sub-family C member 3-like [Paramacrobiotus metropolitanus]|uniref:ATP-binding cassette sub-family C member 3-like n=1 Tax=Paramacrobiotus metropolitanus TaxID=2943436 RepID=UPI002445A7F1|nr:ATP-binding cassette sub-family C member 3-like [Paramacrobiotus metropolitanus]XP_055346996.1 ATP-binding cassette sub-family C member 3-like [Paramacrobiotus metropolitanus]
MSANEMDNMTYHPFPETLCRDRFWDLRTTWYTTDPDFTECFHSTVLVWGPCLFLWLLLPLQGYYVLSIQYRIDRWTWQSLAKLAICFLLIILCLVDAFDVVAQWSLYGINSVPSAEFIAQIVRVATLLVAAGCIYMDKRRARSTSGILFFFWFFLSVAAILAFRNIINKANTAGFGNDQVHFATQVIYMPLVVIQFILSCFGERFKETENNDKNPCPEKHASFLSQLTFWWFNPMAILGWRRPLQLADLWDVLPWDRTEINVENLERNWRIETERRARSLAQRANSGALLEDSPGRKDKSIYEPSLTKALWRTYWWGLTSSGLLRILSDLCIFISPQILQLLIGFVDDPTQAAWKGYLYATIMLLGAAAQTILLNYYLHITLRLGMHVRGSVVAEVYRKALRITSEAKRTSNIGEIVNLMSVDAQRFMDFLAYIHVLWSGPLQMGLAIFFLYQILGIAVLAGLGTMVALVPLNAFIVGKVRALQISQMKEKDGRIKIMTEILNGMKVLKLYAWEESFQGQVTEVRERELTTLRKAAFLGAVSYFTWMMSPFLVALATFATYVTTDPENNVLTAERVFVALALLNILRLPLTLLPTTITMAVQVSISIKRLANFLRNEEIDPNNVQDLPPSSPSSVIISDASFAWGKDDPVCLSKIDLAIKDGQLVAVVGQVGSGKSSMCSAMLGLMEKLNGSVAVKGNVAYVPQQAWIQNLTLEDNILFGKDMERERYEKTLDVCSLRTDLAMLAAGDKTEIGERGTNLSGGQRQRVSLARAVYSNADVYILDDPLSAVDAHVGKHIFEHVIGPNGMLTGKTRVLVTHGISYLPQVDLIVVLDNGAIREVGTYQELLTTKGAFSQFLRTYLMEERGDDDAQEDPEAAKLKDQILQEVADVEPIRRVSVVVPTGEKDSRGRSMSIISQTSVTSAKKIKDVFRRDSRRESKAPKAAEEKVKEKKPILSDTERGKLVDTEKSEVGSVKWSVYFMFMRQMSFPIVIAVAIFYGISYAMSMGTNFWLGSWSRDAANKTLRNSSELWIAQRDYRLGVYASFGGLQAVFVVMAALTLAVGRIRASRLLHHGMLKRIMRAPMAFFDTTPLGRIVNRFSKDVDTVDTVIPATLDVWMYCAFTVLSTVVVICVNTPLFVVLIVPLGIFYFFMQRFYISTSRQLKRLESTSRSPIYSHFQESISGTSVIIATKHIDRFVLENERLVDGNNGSYYPNIVSQRWIAVRLEIVGVCVSFGAALFAVIGRDNPGILNMTAEQIGLSISYSLAINQVLNWFVRMTSDLESNVVSVERLKEYSEVDSEAEWIIPSNRPDKDWPTAGQVQFVDYKTRYRPGLDLVLKGVNATVSSGEKIGIVGRTGAGKSSLTLALFRLIEAADGHISIDNLDIASVGLHDVRSRITILPQEPVLFSGTLRINLDPFNKFSDEDVWLALENSHLKRFVSSLPQGLNHIVADGGENYSIGQRQLICLARALLRKTKILILDEATAAVDLETDALIQQTIAEKFADCTILTIAHRINTIMDSTRIMVLDQGRVKEFAPPQVLLADRNSIFYSLAKTANLV